MALTTDLYGSPWEALNAAARAAKADVCGANTVHPSHRGMDGRSGCGIWVRGEEVAERMAAGLRLTGFDVVILPGYSTGVVIRVRVPSVSSPDASGTARCWTHPTAPRSRHLTRRARP